MFIDWPSIAFFIPSESACGHHVRQPGDLRVLRGVAGGVAEEARTRGFASQALAGFAFIANPMMRQWQILSIRENTQKCRLWVSSGRSGRFWLNDSFRVESGHPTGANARSQQSGRSDALRTPELNGS